MKPQRDTSGNVTELAREGILLDRHYVHWHCSPSRRSFLTGRLPIHHGEFLSGENSDDIDLRWSWLTDKLKQRNYQSYWYGKGHTGYKSMRHLPEAHGFDGSTFFQSGAGSYTKTPRWNGSAPLSPPNHEYSTDFYSDLAIDAIERHDPSKPMFMYIPFQAVHTPYDAPPMCEAQNPPQVCKDSVLHAMFQDADAHIGRIVEALKQKQMYDNTLVIYSADNGGVTDGNNYPLRGEKHTSFEGGMRVTAFVSGGKNVIPESKRGTTDSSIYHIVDWYPTICHLAGVEDCSDDAATPPLKPDLAHPSRDLYQGNASYPSLDGLNIWDSLMATKNNTDNREIVLSAEVIISGRYKLVVAQPDPKLMASKSLNLGWKGKDGAWEQPAAPPSGGCLKYKDRTDFKPCLFDVVADPSERHDLASAHP